VRRLGTPRRRLALAPLLAILASAVVAVCGLVPADPARAANRRLAARIAGCDAAALRGTTAYRQMVGAQVESHHALEDLCGLVQAQRHSGAAASLTVRRAAVTAPAPGAVGQWSAPFLPTIANPLYVNGQLRIITAVHLVGPLNTPLGARFLMFGGYLLGTAGQPNYELQSGAYLYDPVTHNGTEVDPPRDANIFCGAAMVMADGNVLVAGGLDPYSPLHGYPTTGIPVALVFNPTTMSWSVVQSMRQGRWYATLMREASGRIFAIGGRDQLAENNTDVEAFTPTTATWSVVGSHAVDVYEHTFLLPNGKFAVIGPHLAELYDPVANSWSTMATLPVDQFTYPAGVLLPGSPRGSGKMLITGGRAFYTGAVLSQTAICDTSTRRCASGVPLPQPRSNMNLVYGCDGTLYGIGGNSLNESETPQYAALQYVPWATTPTWTTLASQTKRRAYHSTAALQPDCSILSAGDDKAGGALSYLEVFQPPYLFKGTRPAITSAPSTITFGVTYPVTTSTSVVRAALIAPNAVTHADDMNERYVPLTVTPTPTGLTVTAPPTANVAPPGLYWLSVVDAQGDPVQALWPVMLAQPVDP
jgi:Domain of unknown function (DUF1929)